MDNGGRFQQASDGPVPFRTCVGIALQAGGRAPCSQSADSQPSQDGGAGDAGNGSGTDGAAGTSGDAGQG
jgi:hypothetical protein